MCTGIYQWISCQYGPRKENYVTQITEAALKAKGDQSQYRQGVTN